MEKEDFKFIPEVAPLIRLPFSAGKSFSYLSRRDLPPGTLVEIQIGRKKVSGIVLFSRQKRSSRETEKILLKKISAVEEEKFLSEKQILLAQFISDYYFSPLGTVLKNFIPRKTKFKKGKNPPKKKVSLKKIALNPEQKKAVEKISRAKSDFLLFGPSGSGKTEVYLKAVEKIRAKNPDCQFLILLPEKTLTPQALDRYGERFPEEEIAVFSSEISKGQIYSHWRNVRSGKAKIIIGTRMAVFAPFQKLGLVVVDEEHDPSHKQWEMSPRYDARTVAEKLSRLHDCPLILGSATPRTTSFWRAEKKELELLQIPPLKKIRPEIVLVDMKKERWGKNYSMLSKKLVGEIAYALKNRQQTVLFVSRQGLSSFSVCQSCKTVLRCPKCDRALLLQNDGKYLCPGCRFETSLFPKCQKCQDSRFKNIGFGTQKVKQELEKIFFSAKILTADRQSVTKNGTREKIYQDFSQGKADVLIGTQMITKGWDLPRVSLVAIIDADNLFGFPDFFAQEKAFETIWQTLGRSGRPGSRFPGTGIIQTFNPQNKIIQKVFQGNYEDFFREELEERKALNLPPFGNLIKLVFQNEDFKKVETETRKVFERLSEIPSIKISEPENSFLPKSKGRFRKQMILKFEKEIPAPLVRELRSLPPGWTIDRDPISSI